MMLITELRDRVVRLEALVAELIADGWQQMGTVPKDGTWILVFDLNADGVFRPSTTVRQYRKGVGDSDPFDFYDHLACRNPSADYVAWMPQKQFVHKPRSASETN